MAALVILTTLGQYDYFNVSEAWSNGIQRLLADPVMSEVFVSYDYGEFTESNTVRRDQVLGVFLYKDDTSLSCLVLERQNLTTPPEDLRLGA